MKRWRWLAMSACLAGCAPLVESDKPLFEAAGGQPKPGLWAVMDADCAPPRDAAVGTWPECATPVWLRDGAAAAYVGMDMDKPGPGRLVRFPIVGAEGSPYVLQIEAPRTPAAKEVDAPGYMYWALKPDGQAPFDRASVWIGVCPDQRVAKADGEEPCAAETDAEVRTWLTQTMRAEPAQLALWIAP